MNSQTYMKSYKVIFTPANLSILFSVFRLNSKLFTDSPNRALYIVLLSLLLVSAALNLLFP